MVTGKTLELFGRWQTTSFDRINQNQMVLFYVQFTAKASARTSG